MKLIPVSFDSLSTIKYEFALAPSDEFATPEFLLIKFSGSYRDGSAGAPDAMFIIAIIEAARRAWFADGWSSICATSLTTGATRWSGFSPPPKTESRGVHTPLVL